jgi:hypothetical protein
MQISSATDQTASLVQVAVQKQMLDQLKTQGAGLVQMLSTATPGSVNAPSQGTHIDAFA